MAASLVSHSEEASQGTEWSIPSSTVKQVLKQMLAVESPGSIKSVLTRGYVESMSLVPGLASLLSELPTVSPCALPHVSWRRYGSLHVFGAYFVNQPGPGPELTDTWSTTQACGKARNAVKAKDITGRSANSTACYR